MPRISRRTRRGFNTVRNGENGGASPIPPRLEKSLTGIAGFDEVTHGGIPKGRPTILRAEIRRLFRWLKDRGLTTVLTAERGDTALTRYGLEEYVSDCVISLDHRATQQLSTRRMRIIKYRGSPHGTDEYPFVID